MTAYRPGHLDILPDLSGKMCAVSSKSRLPCPCYHHLRLPPLPHRSRTTRLLMASRSSIASIRRKWRRSFVLFWTSMEAI